MKQTSTDFKKLIYCFFLLFSLPLIVQSQSNGAFDCLADVTTIGSNPQNLTGYNSPSGIAIDASGNIFITDTNNHRIRKIDTDGNVSTIAGSAKGFLDGSGTDARFLFPTGITIDNNGNLFVTDTNNSRIRKIDTNGNVSTIAGFVRGFEDGQGTNAKFDFPTGIAVDIDGNLFVTDTNNDRIRKIDTNGNVSTIAGSTEGFQDGLSTAAKFNFPTGITLDNNGNLFITDTNNDRIRKVDASGNVSTLAGSTEGTQDGLGINSRFSSPHGIVLDNDGNIFVTDTNNDRIRKIDASGNVSTLAGSIEGFQDGLSAAAKFNFPNGIAVDNSGNVLVTDLLNNRIRKVDTRNLTVSTVTPTNFNNPFGIAVNINGEIFVSDRNNHRIQRIETNGNVSTLAGSIRGFQDGEGTNAQFHDPNGIAVDNNGNVFVADRVNHRIRKIDSNGNVSTYAGSVRGAIDGPRTSARFAAPNGIAIDNSGNIYVADLGNNRIRKIDANGNVSTIAGSTSGFQDGLNTDAKFFFPIDIAIDNSGNIFVADLGNHRIRKIDASGNVNTIAGSISGFQDGIGANAKFDNPNGVAVDENGNIFVVDKANHRIRKIDANGNVSTIAGAVSGFQDGTGDIALFNSPSSITLDSNGNLFVSDELNNSIRKISCGNRIPQPCENNGGDIDGDGICADEDCDDNNPDIGAKQPAGTSCDDGNPNTINDVIQSDGCTCLGEIPPPPPPCENNEGDLDGDGVCADVDCDDNDATIGAKQAQGTSCDDNNSNTINDAIQSDGCTCLGEIPPPPPCENNGGDLDGDGVCADVDCDDNDATIGAKQAQGTSCDDNNSNTINDVIQSDGCTCLGEIPSPPPPCENNGGDLDGDGVCADVDCDDNDATIGAKQAQGTSCDDNNSNTINDVIQSDGCTCLGEIPPPPPPCENNGGDLDGDGVCADVDCDDNDATIGAKQAQGTSCDDNNSNTINDVIQSDGCTCLGEIPPPPPPCENNGGDLDGDGVCADVDCDDNDATIGAKQTPGTLCNNGTGVILAEGCTCSDALPSPCSVQYALNGNNLSVTGLEDDHNKAYLYRYEEEGLILIDSTCSYWEDCFGTKEFRNLPDARYGLHYQTYINDWASINCDSFVSFTINTVSAGCETITVSKANNQLIVEGLNAPNIIFDLFNENYFSVDRCIGDCGNSRTVENLATGQYFLKVKFYDVSWNQICEYDREIHFTDEGIQIGQSRMGNRFTLAGYITQTNVSLQWANTARAGKKEFILEKSTDGLHFEQFMSKMAIIGKSSYTDLDPNPIAGDNYYRATTVFDDGHQEQSETIHVTWTPPNRLNLFPNPAMEKVHIGMSDYLDKEVDIIFTDLLGRVVYRQHFDKVANPSLSIDLNQFEVGTYHVSAIHKGFATTVKLAIIR